MTMIISGSGGATFPDSTTQTTAASLATPLAVTGNSTSGAEIRLPEDTDNGSNYVALKAADSIATNLTLTLPAADGTSGQALVTNGSGTLSFGTAGAPGVDVQTFTSSGTWTKPSSYAATSRVLIQAWGAGASGARSTGSQAAGGGGGAYTYGWLTLSQLGSTETITIGAGGAAKTTNGSGNDGGNTTVGSLLTAYGGGAGDQSGNGGGGGGALSKGNYIGQSSAGDPAGSRRDDTVSTAFQEGSGGRGNNASAYSERGNVGSGVSSMYKGAGGAGVFDNGCGQYYAGTAGSSIWGGGGGGGSGGAGGGGAGGTSKFGGNGGAGLWGTSGNATAGSQPGGGGGGRSNLSTGNSGAGGDGKVIITVFAGV